MKEFIAQAGGRYTYADDFMNLQDLALVFSHIFEGCGNFVISGCTATDSGISSGYVYINNKIREFKAVSGISYPYYIAEENAIENVAYKDMGDKPGRYVYGCSGNSVKPGGTDPVTGLPPQYITVERNRCPRLADAFFGKYAVMVDEPNTKHVKHDLVFDSTVRAQKVEAGQLSAVSGEKATAVRYTQDGNMMVTIQAGNHTCGIEFDGTKGAWKFSIDQTSVYTVTSGGIMAKGCVSADKVKGGALAVTSSGIYNEDAEEEVGIEINMTGFRGGKDYWRNTIVGDGRGTAVLSVLGGKKYVKISGTQHISSSEAFQLTLRHPALSQSDPTLKSGIRFTDRDDVNMASVGYLSNADKDLYLRNELGSVRIEAKGSLFVNGEDIFQKLIQKSEIDGYLKDMVKKTDSIQVFIDQAGGGKAGQASVRKAIGAISAEDLEQAMESVKMPDSGWNRSGRIEYRIVGNLVFIYTEWVFTRSGEAGDFTLQLPKDVPSPSRRIEYPYANYTASVSTTGEVSVKIGEPCREYYCSIMYVI